MAKLTRQTPLQIIDRLIAYQAEGIPIDQDGFASPGKLGNLDPAYFALVWARSVRALLASDTAELGVSSRELEALADLIKRASGPDPTQRPSLMAIRREITLAANAAGTTGRSQMVETRASNTWSPAASLQRLGRPFIAILALFIVVTMISANWPSNSQTPTEPNPLSDPAVAPTVDRASPSKPSAPSTGPVTSIPIINAQAQPQMTTRSPAGGTYALGSPGDLILNGDWTCSGRMTPALVRPSGLIAVYFDWAPQAGGSGRPPDRMINSEPISQAAVIDLDGDGCNEISYVAGSQQHLLTFIQSPTSGPGSNS